MNFLYAPRAQIAGGIYRVYTQMRNAVPAELNLLKYLEIGVISARAFLVARGKGAGQKLEMRRPGSVCPKAVTLIRWLILEYVF